MVPAHHLDVPVITGEAPPALQQVQGLFELALICSDQPFEGVEERVGASEGRVGPHGRVAVRQLDRAIQHRHALAVLAD